MNINTEIALTHLLSRKKQTIVTTLGVTIGVAMFIFMNSLMIGVNQTFDNDVFKSTPHIRIYKKDEICKPLLKDKNNDTIVILTNPKIYNSTKNLVNPTRLVSEIKNRIDVVAITPSVNVKLYYNNGGSQVNGYASGVDILQANAMFNIRSTMVEGDLRNLVNTHNGILIGVGIADKLNVKLNDNISIASSTGTIRQMKVVGIFKTYNAGVDESKSFISLASAQQLLQQGPCYVTDIYVNVKDPAKSSEYVSLLKDITGYTVEDWQVANVMASTGGKVRSVMMLGISLGILLVASFGIYNIINMTISQKLNDIAILKATGFSGKDVVEIFAGEALLMGIAGTFFGFWLSVGIIKLLSFVYIGGDIGYLPIHFEPSITIKGIILGLLITLAAGLIPARKAANVDPVAIFRR
jgi:lipoprotein-releasing system permease protein